MAEAAAAELNRQLPGRVWRRQVRLDRVVIGVAMACLVVLIAFTLISASFVAIGILDAGVAAAGATTR